MKKSSKFFILFLLLSVAVGAALPQLSFAEFHFEENVELTNDCDFTSSCSNTFDESLGIGCDPGCNVNIRENSVLSNACRVSSDCVN